MLELWAAIEAETGYANDRELHRQHVALLTAWIVSGGIVNGGYFAIREGGGVEARRVMCILVKPEADRILWLYSRVLRVFDVDGVFPLGPPIMG